MSSTRKCVESSTVPESRFFLFAHPVRRRRQQWRMTGRGRGGGGRVRAWRAARRRRRRRRRRLRYSCNNSQGVHRCKIAPRSLFMTTRFNEDRWTTRVEWGRGGGGSRETTRQSAPTCAPQGVKMEFLSGCRCARRQATIRRKAFQSPQQPPVHSIGCSDRIGLEIGFPGGMAMDSDQMLRFIIPVSFG